MAKEKLIIQQMKERKWKWIGYTLRKDSQVIERQVLNWNPQGRQKRGWSLGPKQDLLEMLRGSPMLLKE
jgi:hypothetical protein